MNNTEGLNQEDLKQEMASISNEAKSYLAQLQKHKADIQGRLADVEVTYSPDNRVDITKAVTEIFGKETVSKTDNSQMAITLDMYQQCLEIIRQAGKFKAETLVKDKVF